MTPEDQAKLDRLIAATKALQDSAEDIADREDLKAAIAEGAAIVLGTLTPLLAGLAGGPGGPAASAVVAVVGSRLTQELQKRAGQRPARENDR